jgi:hypothetical protein
MLEGLAWVIMGRLLLILSKWAKIAMDESTPENNFPVYAYLRAWNNQIYWTGKVLSINVILFGLIRFFARLA